MQNVRMVVYMGNFVCRFGRRIINHMREFNVVGPGTK